MRRTHFVYIIFYIVSITLSLPFAERSALAAEPTEQVIDPGTLLQIRDALPDVSYPELQRILKSNDTLWYDDESMTPSYQDSVGAGSNATWPDLVAASESVIGGLFNRRTKQWQFPWSTTAGTDRSDNIQVKRWGWPARFPRFHPADKESSSPVERSRAAGRESPCRRLPTRMSN